MSVWICNRPPVPRLKPFGCERIPQKALNRGEAMHCGNKQLSINPPPRGRDEQGRQLRHIRRDVIRAREPFAVVVAPGDGDGGHAGVACGVEIHGRVPDEDAVFRGSPERGGDLEGSGRVGLVGQAFAVSQHGVEGVCGEKFRDDLGGEGVGFVGKDSERDAARAQVGEQGGDASVRPGAVLPRGGVILRETPQHAIEMQRRAAGSHRAGDEHPRPIADEAAHRRVAMAGESVQSQRTVQRGSDAGQRFHQRAVQIENL